MSEWGKYGPCDSQCGLGHKVRSRKIIEEEDEGGARCPARTESATCENAPCPSGNVSSDINIDTLIDLISTVL